VIELERGERAVRVGLDRVGVLPAATAEQLVAGRAARGPYRSLAELIARVPLRGRALEALVLAGACDGLAPLAADGYPFLHEAALARLRAGASLAGLRAEPAPGTDPARLELYRTLSRVRNELVHLGLHLTCHPLAALRAEAEREGCSRLAEAAASAGERALVAGTLAALRRVATRRGPMAFLTLEDESGVLEAVAFPPAYRRIAASLGTPGPFLVEGTLRDEHGALHLELATLKPFHARRRPVARQS
jgi:DNA polymerase III alpha subunit